MTQIAHLLDDFAMGGVTRALTLFEEPALKRHARSHVVPVKRSARIAPQIDADLIVDHMALSWARLSFLVSLRARNPGARIVHVEHSYTRAFEQKKVRFKLRFRSMIRLIAMLLDEIVCVSDAQQSWLAHEVGLAKDKLRVIHPWTDRTELFAVPAAKPCRDRPLKLLAYGRYAEVKNFAELITAMRSLSGGEVQLTLFGDGPERSLLAALAANLPNVEVHGPSDDPQVYLSQCDAVIVPSHYEAFGLVATEARMAGRAVIAANIDGLPEQVREGGLIAPLECANDIVQAIRFASRNDLAQLGAAGRASVRTLHSEILGQWESLINGNNARESAGITAARSHSLRGAEV